MRSAIFHLEVEEEFIAAARFYEQQAECFAVSSSEKFDTRSGASLPIRKTAPGSREASDACW